MFAGVLTSFTARDGENLALYHWQAEQSSRPSGWQDAPARGVVFIVHGLGEHAGRYDHVASFLCNWGFEVSAYDQRGHGESAGVPGTLPSSNALLNDLAEVLDDIRQQHPKLPLILFGHSLGGLVVSYFVTFNRGQVDALVLSPAFDAGLGAFQKLLLKVLPGIAPNLRVANGLDANFISHDPQLVKSYLSDKLVNPEGCRRFARMATESSTVKPGTVTAKCFGGYYHELFNDRQPAPVFEVLKTWLDARF